MAVVPHFRVPFDLAPDGTPIVLEQNSFDEIAQAVAVLVDTKQGTRVEVPDFGLPDQTFLTEPRVALASIKAKVERWEPRAIATVYSSPDPMDELARQMRIEIKASTDVADQAAFESIAGSVVVDPEIPLSGATWDTLGNLTWDTAGTVTWDQL